MRTRGAKAFVPFVSRFSIPLDAEASRPPSAVRRANAIWRAGRVRRKMIPIPPPRSLTSPIMTATRLLATSAAVLVLAACTTDAPFATAPRDARVRDIGDVHADKAVTVLSRNLYLGSDLAPVLGATTPQGVVAGASQIWATVNATNFPARAGALAREIAATRPALIGLQEVTMYRVQVPSDQLGPAPTPATQVRFDFLTILLDSLAARGLDYRVASGVQNIDIELPAFVAPGVLGDVRLTDRDVILARGDVATSDSRGSQFAAKVPIRVGGANGPVITIPRGWTSVVADVDGRTLRFANTHLELGGASAPVQVAQGRELLAILAAEWLPTVLVGDLNSDALGTSTPTYVEVRAAGFQDAWSQARPGEPGLTCCHAERLDNATATFDERIDFVLFRDPKLGPARGSFDALAADVLGEEPADRTPSGLWPSDHAGVVATLRVPNRVRP